MVVKVEAWRNTVKSAAGRLGVTRESLEMPDHETGQCLVVLDNNPLRVRSKCAEYHRKAQHVESASSEIKRQERGGEVRCGRVVGSAMSKIPQESGSADRMLKITIATTGLLEDESIQMYADFDFDVLIHVMRFMPFTVNLSRFKLRKSTQPSSRYKEFDLRCRGEETGECKMQYEAGR